MTFSVVVVVGGGGGGGDDHRAEGVPIWARPTISRCASQPARPKSRATIHRHQKWFVGGRACFQMCVTKCVLYVCGPTAGSVNAHWCACYTRLYHSPAGGAEKFIYAFGFACGLAGDEERKRRELRQ